MSRPFLTPLRSLLTSSYAAARPLPSAIASSSSSPFTAPFSTSSPAHVSKARLSAKRKRSANLALKAQRQSSANIGRPDPVLGYIVQDRSRTRAPSPSESLAASGSASTSNTASGSGSGSTPWDGCRLQRTILVPEEVWSSPSFTESHSTANTGSTSAVEPQHYLPGLTREDQLLLFGALPETTTSVLHSDLYVHSSSAGSTSTSEPDPRSLEAAAKEVEAQEKQVETMKRILDLRNANRKGIEVVNRQRIVDEFGNGQSGSSEVQAALLTLKIRSLHEHLSSHPRDTHNRRPLRSLVHKRASILKYLKRSQPGEYDRVLTDLGLERRAVEGEITM